MININKKRKQNVNTADTLLVKYRNSFFFFFGQEMKLSTLKPRWQADGKIILFLITG